MPLVKRIFILVAACMPLWTTAAGFQGNLPVQPKNVHECKRQATLRSLHSSVRRDFMHQCKALIKK